MLMMAVGTVATTTIMVVVPVVGSMLPFAIVFVKGRNAVVRAPVPMLAFALVIIVAIPLMMSTIMATGTAIIQDAPVTLNRLLSIVIELLYLEAITPLRALIRA